LRRSLKSEDVRRSPPIRAAGWDLFSLLAETKPLEEIDGVSRHDPLSPK
jgi:hypothetical protein